MAKKYFREDHEDESCYTLIYWKQLMDDENIESLPLYEAEIETNTDHFYCREYFEVGLKSESECGKLCDGYTPRNVKNGRCKHSANCYTATDKKIVLINKFYKP